MRGARAGRSGSLLLAGFAVALVVLVAVVAVIQLTHSRGAPRGAPPPAPGAGAPAPAPGALRATPVTGRVTGQVPADCHQRTAGNGQPLPDPVCTPGVVSTAVTQDNLASTICRPGYTQTIRPPSSDTGAYKRKAMAAYHDSRPPSDYEFDHLVSLELGGSNDIGNLWPEFNDHPPDGAANSKDPVENALNRAVCAHKVTLVAAQKAIATDWTTALATLGLPPVR
ncbi:hypothetical protein ACNTMW_00185 [Planosporangium sp. 12N6]|uniref:hypothetical protein n=1 Tax=Planosporangium spinosum TaxID=3402278 RepID=UPI003CE9CE56